MTITKNIKYALLYLTIALFFSCQKPGGNSTGSEYMPDMAHSIAYEANYYNYYYNNTWGSKDDYYEMAQPRLPVEGTIPRGYAGGTVPGGETVHYTPSGSVPYYYPDTDAGRKAAATEVVSNPYQITDAGLAKGKELYDVFCGICHGPKGDGLGYLVREDGGVYPVQPANLLLPTFVDTTNGIYYHAIMYGKNKMGAYQDKLSFEERWQVIHYIRSLQAKERKVEYNQLVNTLNNIDVPAGIIEEPVAHVEDDDHHMEGEHHTDDHHESEGHHGDSHEEDHH